MAAIITPADLIISPRNVKFGADEGAQRHWLGGDIVGTAWLNALSASFPAGERFFIQTVQRFRGEVSPTLAGQIRDFIKQEAFHTREHVAFNQRVANGGYDVAALEARVEAVLEKAAESDPVAQLCVTVALEHFTAIFAHQLLKNPDQLRGAPEQTRKLWLWHAIEEVEHKAVAYDTYMYVTREMAPLKRWAIRCAVFWKVSCDFVKARTADALDLMAADGVSGFRARVKLAWHLLGNPGLVRLVLPMWASYFLPGFHPWMHDDRDLVSKVASDLSLAPATAQ